MEVAVSGHRGTTKPITGTSFYILLALADQDRYGLDIVQEIERRTDGRIVLGPGTLYNAIGKMEAEGLIAEVTPRARRGDRIDPRRRYYRITSNGTAALKSEARGLATLVDAARDKRVLPST